MGEIDPRVSNYNDYDHLQAAAEDKNKVFFVVQTERLGSRLFCVKLEYTYYRPRSGRNKLFDFHMIQWPYIDGKPVMMWFAVGIPKEEMEYAETVCKEVGLEMVNDPQVMWTPGQDVEVFPMKGDNVFFLKNNPNSVQYTHDVEEIETKPNIIAQRREAELKQCDEIIKDDERRMREEFRAKGYHDEQIDRILAHWNQGNEWYMEEPHCEITDGQHRMKKEE
jgi:hypothetical protein